MKPKEYIDKLQTIVMEHDLIIERMEGRLAELREHRDKDEPVTMSIISQIEFFLLNIKSNKLMNESQLDMAIQQEKYAEIERERTREE